MTDNWRLFDPPNADRLARLANDLMRRADLVRAHGWDQYRALWSCGEVLGVALVLGDAELQRQGETTDSTLERWAFTLWGITGGHADTDTGLPCTRAWFDSIRTGIGVPSTSQPKMTR